MLHLPQGFAILRGFNGAVACGIENFAIIDDEVSLRNLVHRIACFQVESPHPIPRPRAILFPPAGHLPLSAVGPAEERATGNACSPATTGPVVANAIVEQAPRLSIEHCWDRTASRHEQFVLRREQISLRRHATNRERATMRIEHESPTRGVIAPDFLAGIRIQCIN